MSHALKGSAAEAAAKSALRIEPNGEDSAKGGLEIDPWG